MKLPNKDDVYILRNRNYLSDEIIIFLNRYKKGNLYYMDYTCNGRTKTMSEKTFRKYKINTYIEKINMSDAAKYLLNKF